MCQGKKETVRISRDTEFYWRTVRSVPFLFGSIDRIISIIALEIKFAHSTYATLWYFITL